MPMTVTPGAQPAIGAMPSAKEQFLKAYDKEHATTMRVLRAYPVDKIDLKPHAKLKSARELAWVFVLERGLGTMVFQNAFANGMPPGEMPKAPESWDAVLAAFEWFLLCDEIHHRGQFSVYLRMADAKVPSIYGPSADEPWM
jgi:hypothetical protein